MQQKYKTKEGMLLTYFGTQKTRCKRNLKRVKE